MKENGNNLEQDRQLTHLASLLHLMNDYKELMFQTKQRAEKCGCPSCRHTYENMFSKYADKKDNYLSFYHEIYGEYPIATEHDEWFMGEYQRLFGEN